MHCFSLPQIDAVCGPSLRRADGGCRNGEGRRYTAGVKAVRRVLLVLGVAGIIGGLARIVGKGSVPRSQGGWRELEGPEFR